MLMDGIFSPPVAWTNLLPANLPSVIQHDMIEAWTQLVAWYRYCIWHTFPNSLLVHLNTKRPKTGRDGTTGNHHVARLARLARLAHVLLFDLAWYC